MPTKIERKNHVIDATNKAPGRLATEIARLLIGTHKATYAPNLDAGDFVTVENIGHMKLAPKKMTQKKYYRHSGYLGGLKETKMKELVADKGAGEVLRNAVSRMLPKNKLRVPRMKRLVIKK